MPLHDRSSNETEWLFVKIFHGPSQQRAEHLLLHFVRPFTAECLARDLIAGYFYILYSEGGAHVRLRLRGRSDILNGAVRPMLERMLPPFFEALERIPLQHTSTAPERPFPSYEYATYEPEYAKYGGRQSIAISEAHFQHSSEAALAVIAAEHLGHLKRHQAALHLIEVLISEARHHISTRSIFYRQCRDYWLTATFVLPQERQEWLQYFEQRARTAQAVVARQIRQPPGDTLNRILTQFRESIVQTYQALDTQAERGHLETPIALIIQNYIHMLCNRLGITILEEAYLCHLLYQWHISQTKQPSIGGSV